MRLLRASPSQRRSFCRLPRKSEGYSLAEVMVVVALCGVVALGFLAWYGRTSRDTKFAQAVEAAKDMNEQLIREISNDLAQADTHGNSGGTTPYFCSDLRLPCGSCADPSCPSQCKDSAHCPLLGIEQQLSGVGSAPDSHITVTYATYCDPNNPPNPPDLDAALSQWGTDCSATACPAGSRPVVNAMLRDFLTDTILCPTCWKNFPPGAMSYFSVTPDKPVASALCVDTVTLYGSQVSIEVKTAVLDARDPNNRKLYPVRSHVDLPWPGNSAYSLYRRPRF